MLLQLQSLFEPVVHRCFDLLLVEYVDFGLDLVDIGQRRSQGRLPHLAGGGGSLIRDSFLASVVAMEGEGWGLRTSYVIFALIVIISCIRGKITIVQR